MQIPVYVIYELLIRLQDLNPDIGEYLSDQRTTDGILVRTTTGRIMISNEMLLKQYEDPAAISEHKILDLLNGFK